MSLLIGLGSSAAALLTWWLLPRLWHRLPTDQVRAHAVGAQESAGKPVGAGLIFTSLYVLVSLVSIPFSLRGVEILGCVALAMAEGFMDDRSRGGWPEYRLGLADFAISLLGAIALSQFQPVEVWLPVLKAPFMVSPWIWIPSATALIWLTINATNCTDGVDGLSGSLSLIALFYLGVILYAIVGNPDVARYLQVPHSANAVTFAMLAFPMAGCLAGYLWYNAHPSVVLMGDAGSRPIGRGRCGLPGRTAEVLDALHAAGWMHGDVTPGNIHVSPSGHVTLIDLNSCSAQRRSRLGRRSADHGHVQLHRPGTVHVGSPRRHSQRPLQSGRRVVRDALRPAALRGQGFGGIGDRPSAIVAGGVGPTVRGTFRAKWLHWFNA